MFGAKCYFSSTNASLAIAVRKSFGRLADPQTGWFEHQGSWVNQTVAGTERELSLFNPDRYLNCLRMRGILAVSVQPHGGASLQQAHGKRALKKRTERALKMQVSSTA